VKPLKIRKIEIQGFKSFADKHVLELNPRINVIVGPNGSGKSNLIDAVNWALGEQSPRSLRGERMEDIVFSGSTVRKPVGMAQVVLYIDNSDGDLPLDYHEITITRRFFRSGESQFLINKISCRLKDIRELFMGTGSGRGSLSIISQGQVDLILNAKPSERRQVFEEAAGISKFRVRCQDTKNQISRLEEDCETLSRLAAEVENNMTVLKREAEKAKKYLEIKSEKNRLESLLLTKKAKKLFTEAAMIGWKETAVALSIKKALLHREHFENLLSRPVSELTLKRAEKEDALREAMRLELEKEHLDDRMQIILEKRAWLQSRIDESLSLLEKSAIEIRDLEQKYESELSNSEKILGQIKISRTEFETLQKRVEDNRLALALAEKKAKRTSNTYVEALRRLAQTGNLQSAVEKEISIKEAEIDKTERRLKELADICAEIRDKIAVNQKSREEMQHRLEALLAETAECEKKIIGFEEKLNLVSTDLMQYREKHSDLSSRRNLLAEMQRKYEGYAYPVQELLNKGTKLSGICGVVGELLDVPETYRVAVEVALGAKINNIVTETTEDAKAAIRFLKEHKSGRLTFLPLDALQAGAVPNEITSLKGCLPAAEIVKVEDRFKPVAAYLLGRTLIVDKLEQGIWLAAKTNYKYTIVTVQGELLHPGGAITGGSLKKTAGGIVGRSKTLEQLGCQITELEGIIASAGSEKSALEKSLVRERQKLRVAGENVTKVSIRLQELDTGLEYAQNQIESLEREAEVLRTEQVRLRAEKEEKLLSLEDLLKRKQLLEARVAKIKKVVEKRESMLSALKSEAEDCSLAIKTSEVNLSALEQKYEYSLKNLQQLNELKADMVSRHEMRSLEHRQSLEEILKLDGEMADLKGSIEANQGQRDNLLNIQKELNAAIEGLENEERSHSRVLRQIAAVIQELQRGYSECRHRASSLRMEINGMVQYMEDNKELECLRICHDGTEVHQLQVQVAALRKQMQELEPVNLFSIEEYQRVERERAGLSEQAEDVRKALQHLNHLVKIIERRMKRQFKEFFNRLQVTFNEVYLRVFGGGSASLQLQEDDILEGEIEIMVQPPGKRLQSLLLLSGGERALIALTLLFAILQENCSPFCILDEVDTSLDESNIEHFTSLLKYYSKSTQFIVVSHRQGTMEAADNLFGITMPEDGVSAVVSVNLEREAG